jgi:hypothetical protein
MGAKIQAFDIFQTPLSSHYPLPLTFNLNPYFSYFIIKLGFKACDAVLTKISLQRELDSQI